MRKAVPAAAILLFSCAQREAGSNERTSSSTEPATTNSLAELPGHAADASAANPPAASASAAPAPCPGDMVAVRGSYCPTVEQICLEHARDYEEMEKERDRARARGEKPPPNNVPERCQRYRRPSRCTSEARREMDFCVDQHEWPNRPGELPALLVTWTEAKTLCEQAGKRLCTADEFNFACEGEDMLPYSYGYERDPSRCNIDRPYRWPKRRLLPYEMCTNSVSCKEALEELDQRVPVGSQPGCTSPFGALDLNGNVNEWVEREGQSAPFRSGLKGGWWGPARSRCRPMVIAHDENYVGYEVGFRCCKDATSTTRLPKPDAGFIHDAGAR